MSMKVMPSLLWLEFLPRQGERLGEGVTGDVRTPSPRLASPLAGGEEHERYEPIASLACHLLSMLGSETGRPS